MIAYYNDNDKFVSNWLRNLIKHDYLTRGTVDDRSITEVAPDDLLPFRQVHMFAGIGGWDLVLQLAGWPIYWPVWTGSCPCQPFSAAGHKKGLQDERHLWPEWFRLIKACHPPIIFGEQVASKLALAWIDAVFSDLESEGYTCWAVDLPALCVGAPHLRKRMWFVAFSWNYMGDTESKRLEFRKGLSTNIKEGFPAIKRTSGAPPNPWRNLLWLQCRDGKKRPIEPSIFPLAYGLPTSMGRMQSKLDKLGIVAEIPPGLSEAKRNRNGRIKGYGNAIVPQVAALLISAIKDYLIHK